MAQQAGGQQVGGQQQAASGGGNATATVATGGTAMFGNKRIFVSSLTDGGAILYVTGSGNGRQTVQTGTSLDAGDGCMVTVQGIQGRQVTLMAQGCGAGQAGQQSGQAASQGTGQQAGAQPAGGASQQPANAAGGNQQAAQPSGGNQQAAQPSGGNQQAAQPASGGQQAANGGGDGIATGKTVTFGEHKVFMSGMTDNAATIYVVGTGRQTVNVGASADLGGGCSVTLDRIQNREAFMSASGC